MYLKNYCVRYIGEVGMFYNYVTIYKLIFKDNDHKFLHQVAYKI